MVNGESHLNLIKRSYSVQVVNGSFSSRDRRRSPSPPPRDTRIQSDCTHSGSDGAHVEYRFISVGLSTLLPSSLTNPLSSGEDPKDIDIDEKR